MTSGSKEVKDFVTTIIEREYGVRCKVVQNCMTSYRDAPLKVSFTCMVPNIDDTKRLSLLHHFRSLNRKIF